MKRNQLVLSFYVYTEHADILACETKCIVELASVGALVGPQSSSHMWTPITSDERLPYSKSKIEIFSQNRKKIVI